MSRPHDDELELEPDAPVTETERAAARAFAEALEGGGPDGAPLSAARIVVAASAREWDEVAARRLRRDLVARARPPRRRVLAAAAVAAGLLVAAAPLLLRLRPFAGAGAGPAVAVDAARLAAREASARDAVRRLLAARATSGAEATSERLASYRRESALSRLAWSSILERAGGASRSIPGTPVPANRLDGGPS